MAGPLDGYRILDLTTVISGPFATMLLADQGADVIKVESVSNPDHARGAGFGASQFTATFLNNNRNKRGVTLDLKYRGKERSAVIGRDRGRVYSEL